MKTKYFGKGHSEKKKKRERFNFICVHICSNKFMDYFIYASKLL